MGMTRQLSIFARNFSYIRYSVGNAHQSQIEGAHNAKP